MAKRIKDLSELKQVAQARSYTSNAVDAAHSQVYNQEREYKRQLRLFEESVLQYVETGVGYMQTGAHRPDKPKHFWEKLAEEMGRPCVYAERIEHYYWHKHIELTIPRTKALENLAAYCVMISQETVDAP